VRAAKHELDIFYVNRRSGTTLPVTVASDMQPARYCHADLTSISSWNLP